jgi:hypothetical protein
MDLYYFTFIVFYICSFATFSFCFWVWYSFQTINRSIDRYFNNAVINSSSNVAINNINVRLKKLEGDLKIVTDYVMSSPASVSSS